MVSEGNIAIVQEALANDVANAADKDRESDSELAKPKLQERSKFELANAEDVLAWVKRLELKIRELEHAARLHKDAEETIPVEQLQLEKIKRFAAKAKSAATARADGEGQSPLRGGAVLLVGADGIGSFVAEALVRAGVGELGILDGQLVDAACLSRSCYQRAHLGWSRAVAARALAQSISMDTEAFASAEAVTARALDDLCGEMGRKAVDVVVSCTLCPAARLSVSAWCVANNTAFIDARLEAEPSRGVRGCVHAYTSQTPESRLSNCARCDRYSGPTQSQARQPTGADGDKFQAAAGARADAGPDIPDAGFAALLAGIVTLKATKVLLGQASRTITTSTRLFTAYSRRMDKFAVSPLDASDTNPCTCIGATGAKVS